jgi:hypothetical protein
MPQMPQAPQLPAVKAMLESIVQVQPPGMPQPQTTVQKAPFVRDALGRTRMQFDDIVHISDPVAKMNYTLDLPKKLAVAHPFDPPLPPPPPPLPQAPDLPALPQLPQFQVPQPPAPPTLPQPQIKDLGTQFFEGFKCRGIQATTPLPQGQEMIAQNWLSEELGLYLNSQTKSPGALTVKRYTDIVKNPPLDPALFQVPPDFKLESHAPHPPAGLQVPGMPAAPGAPAVPGMPQVPQAPGVAIPQVPGVAAPQIPQMPGMPQVPQVPGMPQVNAPQVNLPQTPQIPPAPKPKFPGR